MLGSANTADGLSIYHEVTPGNQAEPPTSMPTLGEMLVRFGHIKKLIVVTGRGFLSLDEIEKFGRHSQSGFEGRAFNCALDGAALAQAAQPDGKLMLETNVADQSPPAVVKRHKSMTDNERDFGVLNV